MSLYIPKPGSIRAKIVELIREQGPQTNEQLRAAFPDLSQTHLREAIWYMEYRDGLYEHEGKLYVTAALSKFYDDVQPDQVAHVAEITPSPYRPTFRPYKPGPVFLREPLRDISFKSLVSNVPYRGME